MSRHRASNSGLWRAVGVLLSGRALAGLLQVAFLAFLARALGVTSYGYYVAFLAAVYLAMNLADFGFGTRLLRLGAEEDPKQTTTWILLIRTLSNVLIGAVAVLLWGVWGSDGWLLGVAVAVYATGDTFGDLGLTHMLSTTRVRSATTWLVLRRVISLGPFAAGLNEAAAISALALAGIVGYGLAFAAMLPSVTRPRQLRVFMRQSMGFWGINSVSNLQQADVLIVSAVAGAHLAGLYGAATRLLNPLNLVTSVLQQVFVPRISAATTHAERRAQWDSLFRITGLVASLIALASLASPFGVQLLFGSDYQEGAPVLSAVCLAAALNALSEAYLSWIYVEGVKLRISLYSGGVLLLGLGALAALSWSLGVLGAAMGLVLPYFLLTLLYRRTSSHSRTRSEVLVTRP
ncbi:lipopolysaccharide biosynthesis protein [Geodermatophilus sp. SYSU D00804]